MYIIHTKTKHSFLMKPGRRDGIYQYAIFYC